ncbi:hypothetical protein HUJ04_007374 [Dendroctonus ponderosae]|nr:hypothetical protein HUJ04_007374 [Dendroctonus ponderosae]
MPDSNQLISSSRKRRKRIYKQHNTLMENIRSNLLNEDETVPSRDWRKALRSQPAFRVVNKTMRGQTQFITIIGLTGLCVLIILYMYPRKSGISLKSTFVDSVHSYNYTYPLSRPLKTSSLYTFKIGIISDLDKKSKSDKEKTTWYSYLKTGFLSFNPTSHHVMVTWDHSEPKLLKNSYSLKDRGMELSELVVFDGRLLTFDDRTGIIFEIINEEKVVPWILLSDGDGKSAKGFKSEWATVKNQILYIGSMGKEWTTDDGQFENHDPQYIKAVTVTGEVTHINWKNEYNRLRESIGIYWPGYMIHESGVWSDVHRRWFFLPRRCSKEQYNDSLDERKGCNVLLSADSNMYDVTVVELFPVSFAHVFLKNFFKMVKVKSKLTLQKDKTTNMVNESKKRKKPETEESQKSPKLQKTDPSSTDKPKNGSKFMKSGKKGVPTNPKGGKAKILPFKGKGKDAPFEKVEDWHKYKQEKKELRMKRIKARTKDNFDKIQQAKKMGEKLRLKNLKETDRIKIINQLHDLLKGHYAKFVLAHDTARIVQWLLKYSSDILVHQISEELIPITVDMLHLKYGIHCVERLLKYGKDDIRTAVVDQLKGHAVKLASHTISAPVVEIAFSQHATSVQKQFLIQEFYGDLYKNSKDPNVKHIRDVYKGNDSMKTGTLNACKANIKRILNKSLLDSGIVQTVLHQFLEECSAEDRADLISELAAHIVVISNSRDGSKAAMQCIWHGTAKDKKVIMKTLKEHLLELSKHEFGHRTIIALLDTVDDTVLLHKIILSEILKGAKDLAVSEYGRKVLLWLVAPADSKIFHPQFIKELTAGREASNSKKPVETRRSEILVYSANSLLSLVIEDANFWLSSGSIGVEMVAIIKSGSGNVLEEALNSIVGTITDMDWTVKDGEKDVKGIEHPALHMVLKKLAQNDKTATEENKSTFGSALVQGLEKQTLKRWLKINRGNFLLVAVWENSISAVQKQLKVKLKPHLEFLKSQETAGAKILLKKL